MTKYRLELFSDGVFAIVLTLLVLDLKTPSAHGLGGLLEIAPALLVHAATFFMVGVLWTVHHSSLARVEEIHSRTLFMNLVALFWITLLPFAAKSAAAEPFEPLGAFLMATSSGGYLASMMATRMSARSTIDDNVTMKAWRRGRVIIGSSFVLIDLIGAALSWLAPWTGYAAALATVAMMLVLRSPPEAEDRFKRQQAT